MRDEIAHAGILFALFLGALGTSIITFVPGAQAGGYPTEQNAKKM